MKLEGKSPWSLAAARALVKGLLYTLPLRGVVIDYRSHPEGAEETLAKVQAASAT